MIKVTDPGIQVVIFGQHCWNTLGQIRSFGEVGVRPDVVFVSTDKNNPSNSKYINKYIQLETFKDGLSYIQEHYCDPSIKTFISTDSDSVVSLLDNNFDSLKERFVFFNSSSNGRLNQYMTKDAQCRLAEQCGLKVPKSEVVRHGELPKFVHYPLVTKTVDSFSDNWKNNYFICKSEQELLEAYKAIQLDELQLQEFIEKENEVALEGISFNQGEELYMPIQGEYLRIGEFGYGSWKRNEAYHLGDELLLKIQQIFRIIKYTGVFEVEFLRTAGGELYFLEINFRHTQYNHALTDMGVNLSKIFVESMMNGHLCIDEITMKSPRVVMNEDKDYYYIKSQKMPLRRWLDDVKKTDSFYVYDKRDKRPFIDFAIPRVKGELIEFFQNLLH